MPADPAPAGLLAADTVLVNGTVRLLDPLGRTASALAMRDGRVLASGSDREMMGLAAGTTHVLDLMGRCAVPGFIETHNHPAFFGITLLAALDAGTPPNDAISRHRRPGRPGRA